MHMLKTERMHIGTLVEGFEATGQFKHPPNASGLTDLVGDIIAIDSSELEVQEEDGNEGAFLLTRHVWHKESVRKGQYAYFKFKHRCTKGRISIQLKTTRGDPDVFVGNHLVPYPSKEDFIWRLPDSDRTKCTIHPFDKGFVVGYMYIAVYGYSESDFSIKVRWKEAGDPVGLPITPRRLATGEFSFDSQQSCDSAAVRVEMQRKGKKKASAGLTAEASLDLQSESESVDVASLVSAMDWKRACEWLRQLDIDEAVLEVIEKEKVPGGQLAQMTLDELIADLGMSKIQAKRMLLNIEGRMAGVHNSPSKESVPSFPLEGTDWGGGKVQDDIAKDGGNSNSNSNSHSNSKPEEPARSSAASAKGKALQTSEEVDFDALTAAEGAVGDFEDLL